jgi:GNAT superfamily N-acetyltransferase
MSAIIRPFQPADREALLQIGAETAFFGQAIEHYMEDRRIFVDAFYTYYTDYEPEHAWVASEGKRVVGFLTGCVDSRAQARVMQRRIVPGLLLRFLSGHYRMGPKTWRYFRGVAAAALRSEIPPVDLVRYPAHLHINLLPDWRGKGLGSGLIQAYLQQLAQLSVPGLHLETTNLNEAACRLYERMGFHLLASHETRMYAAFVDRPVELRAYGRKVEA